MIELEVGAQTGDNAASYKRFGSELLFVNKGKVEAVLDGETYVLNSGDSLNLVSGARHSVKNIHTKVSEVIFFVVPQ